MYKDVFHWTEPLTAWVNYILFFVFERSILYYRIVALVIIFFQAVLFNQTLNGKDCYDQKTSLPTFIYLSFCLLFPDMISLSAVVMGNTFLLLVFYFLISYIRDNEYEQPIFWIGFCSSIAFLFYAPYIVLLPASLFVLILYSPTNARKIVTILYAYLLPLVLLWSYFFWNDAATYLSQNFLQKVFNFQAVHYLSFKQLLLIVVIPLVWMFIGFIAISRATSFVNFQYRIIQSSYVFFVFSLAGMLLVKERSVFTMWQLVPFVVVIAVYFLTLQKRKWFADLVLLSSLGALLFIHAELNIGIQNPTDGEASLVASKNEVAWEKNEQVKTVLVLGNNAAAYVHHKLATPFLNWNLSESYFRDMESYESVNLLDRYFSKELPHIIIDPNAVMGPVFFRLPLVSNLYEEQKKGIYVLKRLKVVI